MEELLEQMREIANAVTEAVFYFRKQNHARAYQISSRINKLGETFFENAVQAGFSESVELLLPIWKTLLEATELGDEIFLADLYEVQLLPAIYEIQGCLSESIQGEPKSYWDSNMAVLAKKDASLHRTLMAAKEDNSRNYIIGWAKTGDLTLWVESSKGNLQMHSAVNPWKEALLYADEMVSNKHQSYLLVGMGLGYEAEALLKRAECQELIILENDLEQLRIAMMYRNLEKLLQDNRVKLTYVKDSSAYKDWLNDTEDARSCCIYYPSVKVLKDVSLKEALENYWVSLSSIRNQGAMLDANFVQNQALQDENVTVLQDEFKNKTMVLIAAGPSLDEEIEHLLQMNREGILIFAVGKVARKLIKAGIRPDYLVMIDAQAKTRWQIRGIEDCQIPLIYLSTVSHEVAGDYKGKRYIAYQEGVAQAEAAARKENVLLFQTGGSVATFALDMGIRMGFDKIVCLGMDMGYTTVRTHAEGIGHEIKDFSKMRKIEGVGGRTVYTGKTLDIYRKWIEKRIQDEHTVTIINASKGARIHGMQEKDFTDCF